jgi:[CysO sulfur-carrier protein]-S-L-cysteine hydrolase
VIEMPADIRAAMIDHARKGWPFEACGLIAGTEGRGERFYPMQNADRSEVTYSLDPQEHLRVDTEIGDLGLSVVGIFHSHPKTEARPSPTDIARSGGYPDAHYILVSLADRDNPVVRAFTIIDGEIEEQELSVV